MGRSSSFGSLGNSKFLKEWENECRDVKVQPFTQDMFLLLEPELLAQKFHILKKHFKKEYLTQLLCNLYISLVS
jgi:hypothetical protein